MQFEESSSRDIDAVQVDLEDRSFTVPPQYEQWMEMVLQALRINTSSRMVLREKMHATYGTYPQIPCPRISSIPHLTDFIRMEEVCKGTITETQRLIIKMNYATLHPDVDIETLVRTEEFLRYMEQVLSELNRTHGNDTAPRTV